MYKNFNLTDEERKQIMEQHGSFGYKKPKALAEEIDSDDEEMELSKLYADDDDDYNDDLKAFDGDKDDYSSAFEDSDDYEDLYDLSVAKQNLPKDKVDDMGYSRTMDMDYEGAKHHDEIPGSIPTHRKYTDSDGTTYNDYWAYPKDKTDEMGYYAKTYGTADPDMESETLADLKKNQPINWPKYTDKDRRDPENMLSWEQKKALIAQRAEKAAAREAAKEKRLAAASLKPGVNESVVRLTESELIELVKKIVKQTTKK